MQERFAAIAHASSKEAGEGLLRIITPDLQPGFAPVPDLATAEGQEQIDAAIDDRTEVIVIDNLSCLVRNGGRENEAESWSMVQGWALSKRAQGKSVLFIHHAGKNGGQRGTSKREDLLDTVICLRHPSDYEQNQGARFEIHFEKSRNQMGDDLDPVEVKLDEDKTTWSNKLVNDSNYDRVVQLANDGLRQSEIATELAINRSTVSRHWRKAQAEGLISKEVGRGN